MNIKVYRSPKNKQWYWRITSAGNNKIVAQGEGYNNRQDVIDILVTIFSRSKAKKFRTQLDNLADVE